MGPMEMRKDMRACTQEHAPPCTAGCPLHVDGRALCAALHAGEFDAALEKYQDTVLFPRLVGAFCPAPCRAVCTKSRAGQAVALPPLEQAAARYGRCPPPAFTPFLRLDKKVAVVGGGVSGLAAAVFLYEKGFQITIYEAGPRLGGRGWRLDEDAARQDFAFLNTIPWEVRPGQRVGADIPLEELLESYDAVYLSGDAALARGFMPNAETLQCEGEPRLFMGGAILRAVSVKSGEGPGHVSDAEPFALSCPPERTIGYDILHSLETGRRAALSIDRYLKKVSLLAGRQREGSYPTELFAFVPPETPWDEAVVPAGSSRTGYTREEAVAEAARCLNCQCLQCARQCVYMRHFENYPYAMILEMATHIRMIAGQRQAGPLINSCSMCGLCGEICPNHVKMAKSVHTARQYLVQRGQNVSAVHDFPLRDMEFSSGAHFALWRNAPGTVESRYLFFPGCQLAAVLPDLMIPSYEYLRARLDGPVGLGLGCCGAPAHWSGYEKRYEDGMEAILAQWRKMGEPVVVTACPTCQRQMEDYSDEWRVLSLWEVFAQHGLPPQAGALQPVLAVQDACGSRHEPQVQNAVRALLAQMGCPVRELAYSRDMTKCCNYGGLMAFGNPALAQEALAQRLAEGGEDYLVYCGACREQCQRGGKNTWHLLELLFGRRHVPVLDVSEKRENRIRVKNNFITRFWPEEETLPQRESPLVMTPQVRTLLDGRRILAGELELVIAHAQQTGRRLRRPQDGHFIAHRRLGCITYWVEYAPEGEKFRVYKAYTHRIQIVSDEEDSHAGI